MCQVLQDTEVFVLAGFEFRSFISFNDATSLSLKQKRKHPAAATWGEACWAQAHGAFHIDQKRQLVAAAGSPVTAPATL